MNIKYDEAIKELQDIVAVIQEDKIGIEELQQKIKRSVELIQFCKGRLRQIEGEVQGLFKQL